MRAPSSTGPADLARKDRVHGFWESSPDTESITVDLGGVYSIKRVVLSWEAAFGRQYVVETSLDGATGWRPLYTEANGNGGVDDLANLSGV